MDRLIEIKVNGHHLSKDNRVGGVQGEANVTALRIEFDAGWDGYAKTVTFYNALGENPVKRILTADLLENIVLSTRVYRCYIPGEALAEAGWFEFVIDGYVDGKRQRSVSDILEVKAAPMAENADEPVDPTPTQAEQLQVQIDTMLSDMQEQAIIAHNAATAAKVSEENAAMSAAEAETASRNAWRYAEMAEDSKELAQAFAEASELSAINASASERGARNSATTAATSATEAVNSAAAAKQSAARANTDMLYAATSEKAAKQSAAEAKASKEASAISQANAKASAQSAATHDSNAQRYASEASISRNAAWESATAAQYAQAAAEKAKNEAKQIAGGEFATEAYVDNAVANASGDIDGGTF